MFFHLASPNFSRFHNSLIVVGVCNPLLMFFHLASPFSTSLTFEPAFIFRYAALKVAYIVCKVNKKILRRIIELKRNTLEASGELD